MSDADQLVRIFIEFAVLLQMREFRDEVDEVICAVTDENFYAVGQFYEDFSQTTDEEVRELLARAAKKMA